MAPLHWEVISFLNGMVMAWMVYRLALVERQLKEVTAHLTDLRHNDASICTKGES